ncbi:helix-turn-helix domain-containing protein [Enterococcus sp. 5H]|uniref:helix-turn-helix domain-containing protein n=1 Tax=Enterococcus sp. 5H TaxID=1229490 RepID=UPI002302AD36|nr:helix-turn-helix domain-containing protein [Enterococcus sp. 5H]MDA9470585.1 Capsule synthesis positive regulator AcpA [Enterococcus sp. 5H]
MDNLHFSLINDQATKRRIRILVKISETSSPLDVQLLIKELNIHKSTFYSDYNFLIATFPDTICLIEFKNKTVLKRIADSSIIKENIKKLLNDQPLPIIIESIFNGSLETITHYCEKLYISVSSIRQLLTLLKKVLKEFDLTISTNPINIIGNEISIRYFYFQYFRYTQENLSIFSNSSHLDFIYHIIREISIDYGSVLSTDYYRLSHWLLIVETRINQGHTVSISSDTFNFYKDKDSFIRFKKAVNRYFFPSKLREKITPSEILFAYLIRLDSLTYEDPKYYFTDDYYIELKKFEKLTSLFFKQAKLSIASHNVLKNILEAFLVNLTNLSNLSPLFQTTSSQLLNLAQKKHPNTLKLWTEILISDGTFLYPDQLAVKLTLITSAKMQVLTKKNILFSLTGDPSTIIYYREMARKNVPKDMNCFFLFNQPLTEDILYHLNIDICIFNFPLSHSLGPVELIQLSYNPSDSEWTELLHTLHKV